MFRMFSPGVKNLASFAAMSLLMPTGNYIVDKACTALEKQYKKTLPKHEHEQEKKDPPVKR